MFLFLSRGDWACFKCMEGAAPSSTEDEDETSDDESEEEESEEEVVYFTGRHLTDSGN